MAALLSTSLVIGCDSSRSSPPAAASTLEREPPAAASAVEREPPAAARPSEPQERVPALPQGPEAPFLKGKFEDEPSALALGVDEAGEAYVVADVGDSRVLLGAISMRLPRDQGSSLRFVATLGSTPIAIVSSGARWDALALDEAGQRVSLGEASSYATLRRASSPSALYLVHSAPRGPVELDTLTLSREELRVTSKRLERKEPELLREIVGLSASASGFAALFRLGTPEDARGGVFLATERGTRELEPLHEVAMLESLERREREVSVVASFEFDRPIAYSFSLDGRLRHYERLEPGAVPSFTTTRARATLDLDGDEFVVRERDATGDIRVEWRFHRGAGRALPVIARDARGFVIAWADRNEEGWGVRLARPGAETP